MNSPIPSSTSFPDSPLSKASILVIWVALPLIVCTAMAALSLGIIPKGVPGEWLWTAPNASLTSWELLAAAATITLYLGYISISFKLLELPTTRLIVVLSMFPAAALVQFGLHLSAPYGYGLAKWPICSFSPGCSGYYLIAKTEASDLPLFLENYPDWVKTKDALHIGTHPPGLIVSSWAWLHFWESYPDSAKTFMASLPAEMRDSARNVIRQGVIPAPDQASIVSIGASHWLLDAMCVWPIFFLVRKLGGTNLIAFQTASLWPVIPSTTMFLPASDSAFAWLVALAVTLSIRNQNSSPTASYFVKLLLCGLILGLGMFFSLVFLPAGMIIAILISAQPGISTRTKARNILTIGAGFLAITTLWATSTSSNPLSIWYSNQINHGRFYLEFPRTYWKWILADFAETTIGLGLPASLLLLTSLIIQFRSFKRRESLSSPAVITTVVLALLALSGKSLSEVGRLWLPFYPLLITPVFKTIPELQSLKFHLWCIAWTMIQLIWLQSIVQVVYPI